MKYIKIYEGFLTEDYYQEISNVYYNDLTQTREKFTNHILDEIKSMLGSNYSSIIGKIESWKIRDSIYSYRIYEDKTLLSIYMYYNQSYYISNIVMIKDEWFLIQLKNYTYKVDRNFLDSEQFFKCDQIDGVKKFLQDFGYI